MKKFCLLLLVFVALVLFFPWTAAACDTLAIAADCYAVPLRQQIYVQRQIIEYPVERIYVPQIRIRERVVKQQIVDREVIQRQKIVRQRVKVQRLRSY